VSVSLNLRYTIDGELKAISVAAADGSWRVLAAISLETTRGRPAVEQAWRLLLAEAIESAAEDVIPTGDKT
jgi:hypothetical protein